MLNEKDTDCRKISVASNYVEGLDKKYLKVVQNKHCQISAVVKVSDIIRLVKWLKLKIKEEKNVLLTEERRLEEQASFDMLTQRNEVEF